jgi:hypothetical protein
MAQDTWYHIAVTHDGTTVKIYINGVLAASAASAISANTSSELQIGGDVWDNSGSCRGFLGQVSDCRLWNVVRTAQQISGAMNNPPADNEPGLIGLWKLNEGAGTVAHDYTGITGDGTNKYSATYGDGRSVFTLRDDGYFGGGIAIDDVTTNLCSNPFLDNNTNTVTGTSSLYKDTFYVNGKILTGVTLVQGVSADIITIAMGHGLATTAPTFSCYMKSTVANPLKTQIRCIVSGVTYYLQDNDTWTTNSSIEKTNMFNGYTNIGQWQLVTYTFPAFPAGTVTSLVMGGGWYRNTSNMTVSLANIQLEQKTYATSFVNGSRSASNLQYIIPLDPNNFTLNFWAKINKPGTSNSFYINMYPNNTIDGNNRVFFRPSNTTALGGGRVVGGTVSYSGNTTIPDLSTNWHMYTMTSSGTTVNIYLDGKLLISQTNVIALSGASVLLDLVSSVDSGGGNQSVIFDELRIDKIARTDDEILSWFYSNSPFYPKGIYKTAY